jgi:hypothetical protein
VNTDKNRFTYCERLDTFFGLQVVNVPKQRQPLPWYFYLSILGCVFVFVFISYFYFARSYTWRTELLTNRKSLEDTDYEDALQAQLAQVCSSRYPLELELPIFTILKSCLHFGRIQII